MKKPILIIVVMALLAIVFIFYGIRDRGGNMPTAQSACQVTCNHIQNVCGGVIDEQSCLNNCQVWTEEMKESIKEYDDCQFLVTQLGLELKNDQGNLVSVEDCTMACQNYTELCLATISEATTDLLEEGFQSCMASCGSFDQVAVDCIKNAKDCDQMMEECGL